MKDMHDGVHVPMSAQTHTVPQQTLLVQAKKGPLPSQPLTKFTCSYVQG
jgi:hypothetical protein